MKPVKAATIDTRPKSSGDSSRARMMVEPICTNAPIPRDAIAKIPLCTDCWLCSAPDRLSPK
jgi:hypothetical protein